MQTLKERVAVKLRELAERRGFKATLALRLKRSQSAITPYVSGEYELGLDELEAISDVSEIPIAELVAPPDAQIKQLNAYEAELVRFLRRCPMSVTHSLTDFLRYFADEEPQDKEARNLRELWRNLEIRERDWLIGVARLLRERTLGPDLREGIVDRLTREANAGEGPPKVGREHEEPPRRRRRS